MAKEAFDLTGEEEESYVLWQQARHRIERQFGVKNGLDIRPLSRPKIGAA